jgi:hypothetical protein
MKISLASKLLLALLSIVVAITITVVGHAQPSLKKVRIGVSETHVGYLPLQVAFHKGYYKDEGIDLEIVLMPTNVINTAALTGQIDINGAVTGTVGAAVQGSPMKLLIVTVGKPLLFLVSRKEIKDPCELRGKRSPAARGGTPSLGEAGAEPLGIDRERRRGVAGRLTASRFAAMEAVWWMLPCAGAGGDFAKAKGFNELAFMGGIAQFPERLRRHGKRSAKTGRNLSIGPASCWPVFMSEAKIRKLSDRLNNTK